MTPTKTRMATHRARKRAGLVQAGPYWVKPDVKLQLDKQAEKQETKR